MNRLCIYFVFCIYPLVAVAQLTDLTDLDKEKIDEIRAEIKAIPKEELGGQSYCGPTDIPYGFGYYMVGAGLIGTKDLAVAVYGARNACDLMYPDKSYLSPNSWCRVGVAVAMTNLDGGQYNLKKCYKEKYNENVPTKGVIK